MNKQRSAKSMLGSTSLSGPSQMEQRYEDVTSVDLFRGGRLSPVACTPVIGNEGGMYNVGVTLELAPIMGRLITGVTGELYSVFVPVQAMHELLNPGVAHAGLSDVIREALRTGNPLFTQTATHEIAKRCRVSPNMSGGVQRVSQVVHLAHNCAVNFLRLRKNHKAAQLLAGNLAITPALIGETVLQRLNGVLDPDDHINGVVKLALPQLNLPVSGIGVENAVAQTVGTFSVRETGDAANVNYSGGVASTSQTTVGGRTFIDMTAAAIGAAPQIFAELNTTVGVNIGLDDFYNAENMDRLTRTMGAMLKAYPENGEEMLLNWAYGLNVETGKIPFLLGYKSAIFGRSLVGATDSAGTTADLIRSDMMLALNMSVPVPRTEFGGVIMTFAVVKPDECLPDQPHPFLSQNWTQPNFVADQLKLDPVPVLFRNLDSDVILANEATVAFFTGFNALKKKYVSYGFSHQVDLTKVANKTAIWQYELPISVTPDNIIYPADIPHYPFADQLADVVTCTTRSQLVVQTPLIFGPTPVEQLAFIVGNDIFDEVV